MGGGSLRIERWDTIGQDRRRSRTTDSDGDRGPPNSTRSLAPLSGYAILIVALGRLLAGGPMQEIPDEFPPHRFRSAV